MLRETKAGLSFLALIPLAVALTACGKSQAAKDAEAKEAAFREKYARAEALFKERCKTAGVVVRRTVKDVEGIELTKIRQPIPWGGKEYFDPMYPEAAMAGEHRGDDYIKQFLMSEFRIPAKPDVRGTLAPEVYKPYQPTFPPIPGYRFIEYVDPNDGARYRCVPTWKEGDSNWVAGQHRCEKVGSTTTRYALDYENLVDPADRALWVAGTRLKVIDKQTGEVIAELTRYVWDAGFGVSTTGRWPWSYAGTAASTVCPGDASRPLYAVSRYFIDTILQPKQGK